MIKLMKAEWYRLIHSHLLKWLIIICLLLPIIPMLSNINWYKMNLSENLILFSDSAIMMMPVFISFTICALICISYQNKVAYYEIMDGHSIFSILFSKSIIYSAIIIIGSLISCGIYFFSIGLINGTGNMEDIPFRIILFFVILLRICMVSVFISVLMKSISSVVVAILRFVLIGNLLMVLSVPVDMNDTEINDISNSDWFITGQLIKLFSGDINTQLIIAIFITFIAECIIWYSLIYIFDKHKNLG